MANTAEIGIKIFLDDSASAGLNAISGILGDLGRTISASAYSWAALSPAMRLTSEIAAGAGLDFLAFSTALDDSIDAAAQLQDTMANVQIAMSATDNQMSDLTTGIENLAGQSRFSSDEIGQAFVALGERGFSVSDSLNYVGAAAIHLAEATHSQVTPATDLLASTMEIFGAKAQDASKYADGLTFAFYNGMPSVTQLSQMIDNLGQEAALLHIPFDQMITTMDYLTRSGIPASEAANSLRYMLQSLTNPTAKAQEELTNLGLTVVNQTSPAFRQFVSDLEATTGTSVKIDGTTKQFKTLFTEAQKVGSIHTDQSFYEWGTASGALSSKLYDANGNFKDLYTNLQQIGDALKGKNSEQAAISLSNLFNVRSGKGASDLLSNITQVMGSLNQLDTAYKNSGGLAVKDASKETATYNGRLAELQTTVTSILAQIGMPLATMFAGWFFALNNLIAPLQNTHSGFTQFMTVFLAAGTVISGAVLIFSLLITILVLLAPTFLPILAVVGVVSGGIILLSAVIAFAVTHFNQFIGVISGIAVVVAGAAGSFLLFMVLQTILPIIGAIISGFIYWGIMIASVYLPAIAAAIVANTAAAISFVLLNLPLILGIGLLVGLAAGFILLMHQTLATQAALGILHLAWSVIVSSFQQAVSQIMPAFRSAIDQLRPSFNQLVQAFNQARPALLMFGQIVAAVLVIALGLLIGIISGLLHAFVALLIGVIQVAAGLIRALMGVVQFFLGFFQLLHGLVTLNGKEIQAGFSQMGQGIANIFGGIGTAIKAIFTGAFGIINGFIAGFIAGVVGFFTHLADVLVGHSIIPDMWTAIKNSFINSIAALIGFILGLVNSIINFFLQLGVRVGAAVAVLWSMAQNGFQNGVSTLINIVEGLPGKALGVLSNLGGALFNAGTNAIHMLASGITNAAGAVTGAVTGVANNIKSFLGFHSPPESGPLSDSDVYMPNMMKMYSTGIMTHIPTLKNAVGNIASILHPGSFTSPSTQAAQFSSNASYGSGTDRGATYNFNVDGKPLVQVVLDGAGNILKMNGITRTMR